ncbi:TolC family protein [Marinobacter hydrocarbonoclasticus]|nr:TolC family protein [Marinobacter nauticus]
MKTRYLLRFGWRGACQRACSSLFAAAALALMPAGAGWAEPLKLSTALEKTLLSHPQLQRFPYQQRQAEALALQAGLRPNPALSLSLENVLGTGAYNGFDGAEATLAFSQLIELGDKRQRRVDLALAQQRQQVADYEVARIEVLAETTRRYYALLRLQALQSWNNQRMTVEQQAVAQVEARAQAGSVLQADVTRLKLQLAESRAEQRRLGGEQALARRQLAAMWAEEPGFETAQGNLSGLTRAPQVARVLDAANASPHYLQLASQARLLEAKRRLEQARNALDLTLGAGVKHALESNDTGLVFNLSVPLQLSDPNQGNLLAASLAEEQQLAEQQWLRSEMRLTLLGLHQAVVQRLEQVDQIETVLLPLAQQWLKEMGQAYRVGQADVRALLDAQRRQFELERQRIELQADAWLQLLELERLTGQPLNNSYPTPSLSTPLETQS